jgi:hypothetical protein
MFKTAFSQPAMGPVTSASAGSGTSGWEPTTMYMIGFVVAEIVAVGWLSKHLLK